MRAACAVRWVTMLLLPVRRLTMDTDTVAGHGDASHWRSPLTVTVRRMVFRVLLSAWVCAGTPRPRRMN